MREFARGLNGDAGHRGEGPGGRGAAALHVLQRSPSGRSSSASATRRARRWCPALGELRPSRLIEHRRRLAGRPLPRPRPPPPGARLHAARAAVQRERQRQARALLLRRLSAQHQHPGAGGLACAGRHRLPLHGELDGPRHRRPDPDGRRGRGLGVARHVHQGAARVPEPGRRHLLPLGLPRDPPGRRGEGHPHLQDPVQRRGGDDRRPAGGRHHQRRRHRAPGRGRGREAGRGAVRRHRQVRRASATASPPAPSSTTATSSTPCSAGCARCPASPC